MDIQSDKLIEKKKYTDKWTDKYIDKLTEIKINTQINE